MMRVAIVLDDRRDFARYCEDLAEKYLKGCGYRIITRNFYSRGGEIDIVARDGDELVFIEVKGKRNNNFGLPQEMVTRRKIRNLMSAALCYMQKGTCKGRSCRFDVVSIMVRPGEPPQLDHLKGAFGLNSI